jgi:HTH-type transcriptional regulator / antitoxin HipB
MKKRIDFEDILVENYGEKGSVLRDQYEAEALAFRLGARKEAKLTQEELAKRTGTKKSYISRIERGQSDIQASLPQTH